MRRASLLARTSTALCSGLLNAGRAGDCAASTSYAQAAPHAQGWQHQPCRASTALTTTSNSVAAVTKSLLVDTLTLVRARPGGEGSVRRQRGAAGADARRERAQMRRFEKQGMSRQQAEALTEHMTELICTNREKIIEQFVSKAALEKVRGRGACGAEPRGAAAGPLRPARLQAVLEQEARIAGFRSEVSKSQELHLASVTRDIERVSNQLEKIKAEIRCGCRESAPPAPRASAAAAPLQGRSTPAPGRLGQGDAAELGLAHCAWAGGDATCAPWG